jgi:hypothetical protein
MEFGPLDIDRLQRLGIQASAQSLLGLLGRESHLGRRLLVVNNSIG